MRPAPRCRPLLRVPRWIVGPGRTRPGLLPLVRRLRPRRRLRRVVVVAVLCVGLILLVPSLSSLSPQSYPLPCTWLLRLIVLPCLAVILMNLPVRRVLIRVPCLPRLPLSLTLALPRLLRRFLRVRCRPWALILNPLLVRQLLVPLRLRPCPP